MNLNGIFVKLSLRAAELFLYPRGPRVSVADLEPETRTSLATRRRSHAQTWQDV